MASYTVTPNFQTPLISSWDGFGTSLAWWANAVGSSQYDDFYADLLFTNKTVAFMNQNLPGLDLSIVRYNIGGSGRVDDIQGATEKFNGNSPTASEWHKAIEGFWKNGDSNSTTSSSFDWSRDPRQRSMLIAAKARDVPYVEFFSNAPMWWMTDVGSSMGGNLLESNRRNFAYYVASCVDQAEKDWGIKVYSAAILNEPSSGWWKFPTVSQEGLEVDDNSVKMELLQGLRRELQLKGRNNILVSGADEFQPDKAIETLPSVQPYVDKVNVHGYYNNYNVRRTLRSRVTKRFWMTEYGDGNDSGMVMTEAITKDINHMEVSGWVYWQIVEQTKWGMLYADYKGLSDPNRGELRTVAAKYYIFAHFTRYIRPGDQILQNSDENTVVARNPGTNQCKFVTANYDKAQWITYNLAGIGTRLPASITVTYTASDGSALFQTFENSVKDSTVKMWASANTVYSFQI